MITTLWAERGLMQAKEEQRRPTGSAKHDARTASVHL
jgi:hypothetical protein